MNAHAGRRVIVHYHVFKNAGSSVDRALEDSFGSRWAKFDLDDSGAKISPVELQAYLGSHPDLLAVSTHQAVPPIPADGPTILPILYFRHPITRAYSAYRFEWGRQIGIDAPRRTFEEYISVKFKHPRANAVENFQVLHIANRGLEARRPSQSLSDAQLLANAKAFVDGLDFFGLVERFDESMVRLNLYLRPYFPGFRGRIYRENVTSDLDIPLADQVRTILDELSASMRGALVARNALDLELYAYVTDRFAHMGLKASSSAVA